MRRRQSRLLHEIFVKSWWVWLFALLCYAVYDYGTHRQEARAHELEARIAEEEEERARLELTHEDLERQLQSQSDPAWIELALREQLGVVAEGETKVYFEDPS